MRKIFLLLVLLWCIVPACASQIPREITDAIPDSARPFLEDTDEADNFTSWNSGLSTLWTRTCKLLASTVQESLGGVILVMSAVLLCSVAEDCFHPLGDGKLLDPVPLVGTLVILLAVGSNMKNLMGLGEETIRELNVFSKALLPTLSAATAAVLKKHCERGQPITVEMPGGTVTVRWLTDGRLLLTGAAEFVFRGEWPEDPEPC